MQLYDWDKIAEEQLNPKVTRKVIHAQRITICRLRLLKGAVVGMHSHENEQITNLESGALKFIFPDGERIVTAGQSLAIPPNVPHKVEVLEDAVAVDIFAPVREDWMRGEDAYLR